MSEYTEYQEWTCTLMQERYRPVTIRTTDREEIARFPHQLPADYRWIDGSGLLKEGEGK